MGTCLRTNGAIIPLHSSVYNSDVGYLGKRPHPSVPRIGPGLRSNLPDVGSRCPMPKVFNTSDWCGKLLPDGFRGTYLLSLHALWKTLKKKKNHVELPCVTSNHMYLVYLGSMHTYASISRIRLYLGSDWLATAHPRYPRLTCMYFSFVYIAYNLRNHHI